MADSIEPHTCWHGDTDTEHVCRCEMDEAHGASDIYPTCAVPETTGETK